MNKKIYKNIKQCFEDLQQAKLGDSTTIENRPYQTLHGEIIGEIDNFKVFAMSHTAVQNGDLMRDPEIVILLDNERQQAHAMSYQNDFLGGNVDTCLKYENGKWLANTAKKNELEKFLKGWSENINEQGFSAKLIKKEITRVEKAKAVSGLVKERVEERAATSSLEDYQQDRTCKHS